MIIHCPKCSYSRRPTDTAPATECPSCGVIFEKYLSRTEIGTTVKSPPTAKASRSIGELHLNEISRSIIMLACVGTLAVGLGIGTLISYFDRPEKKAPPISQEAKDAAVVSIRLAGYKCDHMDFIGKLITKRGFRVTCNGNIYAYEIVDEGGRWIVRLD